MKFQSRNFCTAAIVWGLSLGAAHAGTSIVSTAINFGTANVPLNGSTSLTHTVTANGNFMALNFSTTLDAGMVVATPNGVSSDCAGAVVAVPGSNTVSLTGGSTPTVVSVGPPLRFGCALSVNVQGVTMGTHTATTAFPGAPALTPRTASLQVLAAIVSTASIPTLSEWGLILLVLAMAMSAFKAVRRQR